MHSPAGKPCQAGTIFCATSSQPSQIAPYRWQSNEHFLLVSAEAQFTDSKVMHKHTPVYALLASNSNAALLVSNACAGSKCRLLNAKPDTCTQDMHHLPARSWSEPHAPLEAGAGGPASMRSPMRSPYGVAVLDSAHTQCLSAAPRCMRSESGDLSLTSLSGRSCEWTITWAVCMQAASICRGCWHSEQ